MPIPDCTRITAVEIANGGTMQLTGSVEGSLSHIPFWQGLLDAGCRPTAIGGSDSHDPDAAADRQSPVGRPTTVVYARDLSQAAILDGVRSGRVFIDLGGQPGLFVDLAATVGGASTAMGGNLPVTGDEDVQLTITVSGVPGGLIELITGGPTSAAPETLPVHGTSEVLIHSLGRNPEYSWIRVNVRDADGDIILISNPIYFQ